jgi:ABC-type nitrate/sulfonate/bicarbonate transport system permease component
VSDTVEAARRSRRQLVWSASSPALLLLAWETAATVGVVDPLFVSSPSRIAAALVNLTREASFWKDLQVSAVEFGVGFVAAVVTALALGLVAGWYRRIDAAIDPLLSGLYATPRIALLPLVLIWFGIGIWSKVAIVYLGAFFPIVISVIAGVRVTEGRYVRVARSFSAGQWRLLRSVVLPGSVPFVLSGIRLAVGRGLVGVVVGEFYVSTAGIGHRIATAGASLQTDAVLAGVVIVTVIGALMVAAVHRIERHFERWKPGLAL